MLVWMLKTQLYKIPAIKKFQLILVDLINLIFVRIRTLLMSLRIRPIQKNAWLFNTSIKPKPIVNTPATMRLQTRFARIPYSSIVPLQKGAVTSSAACKKIQNEKSEQERLLSDFYPKTAFVVYFFFVKTSPKKVEPDLLR